jgi:hypothetical protein
MTGQTRLHARSPVLAHCGQITESNAELIDERPPGLGHVRLLGGKLAPTLRELLSVSHERHATRDALPLSSAAQRQASGAAESGSAADAVSHRLHAFVRLGRYTLR